MFTLRKAGNTFTSLLEELKVKHTNDFSNKYLNEHVLPNFAINFVEGCAVRRERISAFVTRKTFRRILNPYSQYCRITNPTERKQTENKQLKTVHDYNRRIGRKY